MGIVKHFIDASDVSVHDENVIDMINKLEITNPYVDVQTSADNLAYLCEISKRSIPESKEFVLGRRKIRKVTRIHVTSKKRKNTFKSTKRIKRLKDVMHYISIKEVLG